LWSFFYLKAERSSDFSFIDKHLKDEPEEVREKKSVFQNSRVLILNQSYEPVSICSAKKAMLMLILSKAELVAKLDGKVIHSPSVSFAHPSVIRLYKYYRVPYRTIELSRKNIMRRDNYRCQYCGKKTHTLTIDHIIPKSRGGMDTWDNLVSACVKCNNKKGNRTPEEAKMPLLRIPRKPNHILFLKQYLGNIEVSWRPFLFMD